MGRKFRRSLKKFDCDLLEEKHFEILLPLAPMLMKKKIFVKNQKKIFFSKIQKSFGHMSQGKPQLKSERNPYNNFRDNRTTDGRWTNFDIMSSADIVKQS